MEFEKQNNLEKAVIDNDSLDLLITAFKLYDIAKMDKNVYRKDEDLKIVRHLLVLYYNLIQPDYNNMIYNFRRKYISNELLVEKNDTLEERRGLNLVYDYIQDFDIINDPFNIFITSLQLHSLLFKPLDEKNAENIEEVRDYANRLREEAKKEKSLQKLREAQSLLNSIQYEKFGGQLRTEAVVMRDFHAHIPEAKEAVAIFNEFLTSEKVQEYEEKLNDTDIFAYIDYAVNTTCDLIGMQPFGDGNKRVFRSLLNLMFKKKGLPPVYISSKERDAYHEALEKALITHDYGDLDGFYYYKLCDSIYELDFKPFLESIGKGDIEEIEEESIVAK